MRSLSFRRTSKVPKSQFGKDIFFVDSDGILKKIDPDGVVSEVGGVGSVHVMAIYSGNLVTVNDGASKHLPFSTLVEGEDLLDRSTLDSPLFLVAGAYAISAFTFSDSVVSTGGNSVLAIDAMNADITSDGVGVRMFASIVVVVTETDLETPLHINVINHNGDASTRNFELANCVIVKLA